MPAKIRPTNWQYFGKEIDDMNENEKKDFIELCENFIKLPPEGKQRLLGYMEGLSARGGANGKK